eukprot:jgi/Tetstr1/448820/TSEL_003788.t1
MLRFVPFAVSEFGSLAPHAEAFLVELAKASQAHIGKNIGQLLSAWRRRFSLLINMAHADNVLGGVAAARVARDAQGPVTLHCLASLVAIGGWWSVLFAPVFIMIGNILDQCRSLDGTPGGTAFNSAALLRAAMVLHGLLASSMLGATCADGAVTALDILLAAGELRVGCYWPVGVAGAASLALLVTTGGVRGPPVPPSKMYAEDGRGFGTMWSGGWVSRVRGG